MQPSLKSVRVCAIALIASLALSACGGGTSGSTWFNLPSIPVKVQPDGTAKAFGINLGPVLPPATVQQLQGADLQELNVRVGYNGVHLYADGADLPHLAWDADSVSTLQDVLSKTPGVPPAVVSWLPTLRQIGLGAQLDIAPAEGAAVKEVPAWTGETTVTPEQAPAAPTIGPLKLGSVAFDKNGGLNIGSVPASALGLPATLLDANTLGLLQSLGLDKLQIKTEPNGIKLSLNDKPLPGIAYDSKALEQVKPLVNAFAPNLAPTLDNVLPKLPGAALDVAVSFTGEPAQETQLAAVPVTLNPDGTLGVFGIPLPGSGIVPPDVLQKLQAANVQTLNVDVGQDGVFLAANGQTLPTITWTPESLNTLATVVAPALGINPELINSGMTIMKEMGGSIKANIALGGGEAAPAEINKTLTTPSSDGSPTIRLNANVQQGAIQEIEDLGNLADLGVGPVNLPPNIIQMLSQIGAKQVLLNMDPGKLDVLLDGNTALTLNWDQPSLQQALTLAGPFLTGTPLEDPNLLKLIQEQILPILPGSNIDLTLNIQ